MLYLRLGLWANLINSKIIKKLMYFSDSIH